MKAIYVTAAILIEDGAVLIARRPSNDKHAGSWEFPGGKIEEGETAEEGLQRELREELGITAIVGEYFMTARHRRKDEEIILIAHFVNWIEGEMIPAFHDQIEWVPLEALDQYDLLPADRPIAEKLAAGLS